MNARSRIPCRAVFLDAGGVIVLPHRGLVTAALASAGVVIDADEVARAHYRAVRTSDRSPGSTANYLEAFCDALAGRGGRRQDALRALTRLADRSRSGQILWSEPTPGAVPTIAALRRAGVAVVVVSNSNGHAGENLRDCGFDLPVIDSEVVGATKPDIRIFEAALVLAGVEAAEAVHVGDMLSADVAGAVAAGIIPIHFDPLRACRATDHRHLCSLAGIWQHVVALT